jgi:hypothetical protein
MQFLFFPHTCIFCIAAALLLCGFGKKGVCTGGITYH